MVDLCWDGKRWQWGGRSGRNCISDAEQLLTILYPATTVASLSLDDVDSTREDVVEALRTFGGALDIPRILVKVIGEYMNEYTDAEGFPTFGGGSYFDISVEEEQPGIEMEDHQRELDIVDSYSMSITLCLATLGFLNVFATGRRSATVIREIGLLRDLASTRLTAAMVGLIRSFAVQTFDPASDTGQSMLGMVNQARGPQGQLVDALLLNLRGVRAGLRRELTIGSGEIGEELEREDRLFECGWSWGVVDGAREIEYVKASVPIQRAGIAENRPYLYYTVVALDGIQDLFTERTRVLGLLNEEQQRLARALQLRYDLTRQFWATLATFGEKRWPLEDVPWRTTDGRESDYYSLLLATIVLQYQTDRRGAGPTIRRIGALLEEMAARGRITRRATDGDQAVGLHVPGMRLRLNGSKKLGGPLLEWSVSSYSLMLFKRVIQVASLLSEPEDRARFLDLADDLWDHLRLRRIGSRDLWDQPAGIYALPPGYSPYERASWYHTERVMEALVAAAELAESQPIAASNIDELALAYVIEAEHVFDQELMLGTDESGVVMRDTFQTLQANLRRAREHLGRRPATAITLAQEVLRELDALAVARSATSRFL